MAAKSIQFERNLRRKMKTKIKIAIFGGAIIAGLFWLAIICTKSVMRRNVSDNGVTRTPGIEKGNETNGNENSRSKQNESVTAPEAASPSSNSSDYVSPDGVTLTISLPEGNVREISCVVRNNSDKPIVTRKLGVFPNWTEYIGRATFFL